MLLLQLVIGDVRAAISVCAHYHVPSRNPPSRTSF